MRTPIWKKSWNLSKKLQRTNLLEDRRQSSTLAQSAPAGNGRVFSYEQLVASR